MNLEDSDTRESKTNWAISTLHQVSQIQDFAKGFNKIIKLLEEEVVYHLN